MMHSDKDRSDTTNMDNHAFWERGENSLLRGAVSELIKVFSVKRNSILIAVAVTVMLLQPWAFLATFGWLSSEGVESAEIDVIALNIRNQTPAFLLVFLLGQQAYTSDASHGMLHHAIAGVRGRRGTALDKVTLGVSMSMVLALLATTSAYTAGLSFGSGVGAVGTVGASVGFWLRSWAVLSLALTLYYLIGLLIAVFLRSKTLGVVAGIMLIWVVIPAALTGLGMASNWADVLRWAMPTELAAAVLAWTPQGNALVPSMDRVWLRTVLLVCWALGLSLAWMAVIRKRQFYPSDQI